MLLVRHRASARPSGPRWRSGVRRHPLVLQGRHVVRAPLDNGQPATPWSSAAPFKAAFLAPSRTLPEEFENLKISDQKTIKFLALYPCYLEESALARQHGAQALWQKFVDNEISDIINPRRANLVGAASKPSFWRRMMGR